MSHKPNTPARDAAWAAFWNVCTGPNPTATAAAEAAFKAAMTFVPKAPVVVAKAKSK